MKTLSVKIPESLDGDLVVLARQKGVTKSELIRAALARLSSGEEPAARGSALALVEDLVGCVAGPGDLSYDKRHLDAFGR
jgi:hypothetical protein